MKQKKQKSILQDFLEKEYQSYLNEKEQYVNAGLSDPERTLGFEEWAEDFAASNF